MMHDEKSAVFLTIIAGRKQGRTLMKMLSEMNVRIMNATYGRGSVKAGMLMNVLGLCPEENKLVITCLMLSEKADRILDILIGEFDFNKPNTGIAFTVPVEKLSF